MQRRCNARYGQQSRGWGRGGAAIEGRGDGSCSNSAGAMHQCNVVGAGENGAGVLGKGVGYGVGQSVLGEGVGQAVVGRDVVG